MFCSSLSLPKRWSAILARARLTRQRHVADVLTDFFGALPAHGLLRTAEIHHVAIYLDDYDNDADIEAWYAFLNRQQDEGRISALNRGPSYIAAKYYGTQGWWFSLCLTDNFQLELFSCRHFGAWTKLPVHTRHNLMSHVALAVDDVRAAEEMLIRFAPPGDVVELVYTEDDELGHNYCHLRHEKRSVVLELIHDRTRK